jgi:osmoprotectant transport system permease protein
MPPGAPLLDASDPWIRWDWLSNHTGRLWDATSQHIELTLTAIGIGLLLSLPLGLWIWRRPRFRGAVLGVTGVLYTIPSLALFALLIPFTGLSVVTAEIGLISYTLQILIRNIVVGLDSVPQDVREAATGMGYTTWRRLLQVELPLSLPVIVAGIRVATVTTIGLVTVTALIGEGGLGQLILQGLIQDFKTPIVAGSALSILLAVIADGSLTGLQRALTPWARVRTARR